MLNLRLQIHFRTNQYISENYRKPIETYVEELD